MRNIIIHGEVSQVLGQQLKSVTTFSNTTAIFYLRHQLTYWTRLYNVFGITSLFQSLDRIYDSYSIFFSLLSCYFCYGYIYSAFPFHFLYFDNEFMLVLSTNLKKSKSVTPVYKRLCSDCHWAMAENNKPKQNKTKNGVGQNQPNPREPWEFFSWLSGSGLGSLHHRIYSERLSIVRHNWPLSQERCCQGQPSRRHWIPARGRWEF